MTTPASNNAAAQTVWYARPALVLSVLAILVLLTVLLVKSPASSRDGDPRLMTTSKSPLGASLLYELAHRLGYNVSRERTNRVPTDSQTILAVLDPVVELDAATVHAELQHVRGGGSLVVVLGDGTGVLSDSIGVSVQKIGGIVTPNFAREHNCNGRPSLSIYGLWASSASLYGLNIPDSLLARVTTFIVLGSGREKPEQRRRALIGMPFGAGRVVVASDPDVFRNDALRNCWYALDVPTVAALEYLRGGPAGTRTSLVFDEYHLELQHRPSVNKLIEQYLTSTASGRTLLQICAAALLLLLGAAPRVLSPREDRQLERRSPLEHVDALSRAYSQVGATRTGTLRLVRGLQRRVGAAVRRIAAKSGGARQQDEEFLARVAESKPALAKDVAAVVHALGNSVDTTQFREVGSAIQRIEAALTKT
ncbi:MAG: DUF4350 domain-containing protein [Gemmatimonadaceae bacterium]